MDTGEGRVDRDDNEGGDKGIPLGLLPIEENEENRGEESDNVEEGELHGRPSCRC